MKAKLVKMLQTIFFSIDAPCVQQHQSQSCPHVEAMIILAGGSSSCPGPVTAVTRLQSPHVEVVIILAGGSSSCPGPVTAVTRLQFQGANVRGLPTLSFLFPTPSC
jgi:phosphoribosylcarboxyaminoimidazole (NCAIR) mutase